MSPSDGGHDGSLIPGTTDVYMVDNHPDKGARFVEDLDQQHRRSKKPKTIMEESDCGNVDVVIKTLLEQQPGLAKVGTETKGNQGTTMTSGCRD